MADTAEATGDAQITFKVKTSSEKTHTITMSESATVMELKTKLAGEDLENIAVDRQRLIYSGRVMKNDDTIGSYKVKSNNTIHMVKSAASNPGQPASTSASASAAQSVPSNMASGTANNPLAGLTGARYAGHQVNLPGMDMFGPDGGLGAAMDDERLQRMMSDPNVQQSMNEVLNNPDFVNMIIESNPMLRNMPNAREIITSPFMRQMMANPEMMTSAMRMQRNIRGGGNTAFPAPGATDTTPEGAPSGDANPQQAPNNAQQNPFMMPPGMMGNGNGENFGQLLQTLYSGGAGNPFAQPRPAPGLAQTATQGATESGQTTAAGQETTPGQVQQGSQNTQSPPPANPFAALFPPPGGQGSAANPFGMTPEMMQQMMQMVGSGAGAGMGAPAAAAPPDNRSPEERYAEQLRQLNDMGFFDFDRNVAALRRSGGSVQGAVEHLLGATD